MIKVNRTPCVVAVFDDEEVLMDALKKGNDKGYNVLDCYTPFPVHGIEPILGIKRSNIGVAAFVFGSVGFLTALSLLTYAMRFDWPQNYGGKPSWPLAAFIPVSFELTVLIASLGMTFTYYWICKLAPGAENVIYEPRATIDRFAVLYEDENRAEEIKMFCMNNGAESVRNDEYVTHNFPGPIPFKLK